jgi:hypothetical protein
VRIAAKPCFRGFRASVSLGYKVKLDPNFAEWSRCLTTLLGRTPINVIRKL